MVVEDGRVAASKQHMEVNQASASCPPVRCNQPNRSFLFAFLGPHDSLLPVEVTTSDGQVLSMCSMRGLHPRIRATFVQAAKVPRNHGG